MFGRIITTDLCKCCNEHFGAICDHALAKDPRILGAAKRVGITEKELWSQYVAIQTTASGREFKTVYKQDKSDKGGSYRTRPKLKDLQRLAIVATEGKVNEVDLRHLRARLIEKVRKKGLGLPDEQILREVDTLLSEVQLAPSAKHYNPVIGEPFIASPLPPKGTVTWETRPWATEWCMAKIAYEVSQLVWPANYRVYCAPVLDELRRFLMERKCSEDGKQGVGKFVYEDISPELASKRHVLEGVVTATQASWNLTFFGTAKWSYARKLKPLRPPPDPGYHITITNPFDDLTVDSSCDIVPAS